MKTGRYNIAQLLTSPDVEQIVIPELQRDYVWGERNVTGLLSSILDNYKSKIEQTLEIKSSLGINIESDIINYLNEEYMRLRYNTRVGFIYAYHDRTLSGQYYLIDGQQRITTIYLILLALYRRSENPDVFRKLYFIDSIPKIDYKVRDVAHSFLVDFIKFELTKKDEKDTFKKSSRYYIEYDKDITARSIYTNYYNVIVSKLSSYNDVELLINYVENYIEFNYFDTNMSEQGEKLYLYMNSRGESLSTQERIKSVIIGRNSNKLVAGKKWEDWQNFFWKNKSPKDKNADRGFFEFLKWAAIIHMCINPDTKIKTTLNSDKTKSRIEEIEDYIRIEKDVSIRALQADWICSYISVNENFSFEWLERVESAVQLLHSLLGKSFFLENDFHVYPWFNVTNETNTIEYTSLLGLLYYIIAFKDKEVKEINILRIALYLKNLKSEYTLRRNPDRAVIRCIKLIKWMAENENADVRLLGKYAVHENDGLNDKYVLRTDDLRWGYYQIDWQNCQSVNPLSDSLGNWENFFGRITNDKELNRFLRGNHDFIIKVLQSSSLVPDELLNRFIENVFKCRYTDQLRRNLMEFGDISVYDNGGSNNIGPNWMERWCLLGSDHDDTYWNEYMNGKDSDIHAKCIASYLDGNNDNKTVNPIIKELGRNLGYMKQKFYLWDEKQQLRIILLQDKQASKFKARELCVQYLHKQIANSWMWEHNFCVVNFKLSENGLDTQVADKNTGYYIDLWYDWNNSGGNWYCRLGHKTQNLSDCLIENIFRKANHIMGKEYQWIKEEKNYTSLTIEGPIYTEKIEDEYFKSANFVKQFYDSFFHILNSMYNDGLII